MLEPIQLTTRAKNSDKKDQIKNNRNQNPKKRVKQQGHINQIFILMISNCGETGALGTSIAICCVYPVLLAQADHCAQLHIHDRDLVIPQGYLTVHCRIRARSTMQAMRGSAIFPNLTGTSYYRYPASSEGSNM